MSGDWRSEWSRHYDQVQWTSTTILTAANGGLLAYTYSTAAARTDMFVHLVGIGITWLTVFYAASFRQMRTALHKSLPDGEEKHFLCNQPKVARLRQWPVFMCCFALLNLAWLVLLLPQSQNTAVIFGLLSVLVFIFLWIRGQ